MLSLEPIEQFLASLASQGGFSGNTLSAYRNDLGQFATYLNTEPGPAHLPATDWSLIGRDHIISFILHLKERGFATTTVARKQAAVKSFFKYLVAQGVLKTNPGDDLASPHVDRALPQTITTSEADRLISEIDRPASSPEALRDRAMMHLIYDTGLRVGELVALNTGDLDLDAGTVTIVTASKSRKVPIGSALSVALVRDYLDKAQPVLARADVGATLAQEGVAALFLNHRGQRLTRQGFWLILKRYAERAGLGDVSPHTLRHSFAAQKLMSGTDMRDLQMVLGHASISTTQVYARIGEEKKRK